MTQNGIYEWTDPDGDGIAAALLNSGGGGGGASIGTATPLMDGAASAGVAATASAVDHIHPTDTTRAPLASPTFTGTVTLPTGAVTSAFIADGTIVNADISASAAVAVSKLAPGTAAQVLTTTAGTAVWATPSAGGGATIGTAIPLIDGTASAGVGTTASAVDHVHPTDTSRAALASPTFTGTPVLPTGTTGTTQSAGDNSTKLATTAYVDAKERALTLGKGGVIGATETNAADFPMIVPFALTMKRMKVVLNTAASGAMAVQLRKASAPGTAVPSYSDVSGFLCTFANGSQIATVTPGTAILASEGDLLNFSATTGSGSNMMVEVVGV